MGNFSEKETRFRLQDRSLEFISNSDSPFFGPHTVFKTKGSEELIFSCKINPTLNHTYQKSEFFSHQNLLKTMALRAQWTDLFGTESDVAFFEFSPWTLRDLINQKKSQKKIFKESELILILKGVVSSLAYLQKTETCHGNIHPQTIFYDNPNDCYKLLDQELINGYLSSFTLASQDKFFSYYLSPEILIALQERNILLIKNGFKTDVFSLGMCLLEAATLISIEECYDKKNLKIMVREIEERMKIVEKQYSFEFYKVLEALIIFDPKKRDDPIEMEKYLRGNKIIEIKMKKLNDRELPKIIEEINICYSSRKERENSKENEKLIFQDESFTQFLQNVDNEEFNENNNRHKSKSLEPVLRNQRNRFLSYMSHKNTEQIFDAPKKSIQVDQNIQNKKIANNLNIKKKDSFERNDSNNNNNNNVPSMNIKNLQKTKSDDEDHHFKTPMKSIDEVKKSTRNENFKIINSNTIGKKPQNYFSDASPHIPKNNIFPPTINKFTPNDKTTSFILSQPIPSNYYGADNNNYFLENRKSSQTINKANDFKIINSSRKNSKNLPNLQNFQNTPPNIRERPLSQSFHHQNNFDNKKLINSVFGSPKPNCFMSPAKKTILLKTEFRPLRNEETITYRIRTEKINQENEKKTEFYKNNEGRKKKFETDFENLEQSLSKLDIKIDKILKNSQQITRASFNSSAS